MSHDLRVLHTRGGSLRFPTYVPVTTFGGKYPLDALLQPYLPRLAQAIMVSYPYARQMLNPPRLPLLIDSGGFASLARDAHVVQADQLGIIEISEGDRRERIHPADVLSLQERVADVAFTLDFPIPPTADEHEARRRQELTIANAHWALAHRRRRDLPLFACVQAWSVASARFCAGAYAGAAFDGIAIGGLVPRSRDRSMILSIVETVRAEIGDHLPLHVFGLGHPEMVELLFQAGADSVDSSSYIQLAVEGRLWSNPDLVIEQPTAMERLHLALCNLAQATQRALPLSAAKLVFTTHALASASDERME